MRFLPWILFGVTALALVGYLGYNFGGRNLSSQTQTQVESTTPQPQGEAVTPRPADEQNSPDTKTYAGGKFSITYPLDVELTNQGEYVSLSKTGPTQKTATEFYDGIALSLKSAPLDGLTVKQFAEKRAAELGGVFETGPLVETKLGLFSGYTFHVKGYVEADYYYLDLGTNTYLEVVDATKDPTNVGFVGQVKEILATLTQ